MAAYLTIRFFILAAACTAIMIIAGCQSPVQQVPEGTAEDKYRTYLQERITSLAAEPEESEALFAADTTRWLTPSEVVTLVSSTPGLVVVRARVRYIFSPDDDQFRSNLILDGTLPLSDALASSTRSGADDLRELNPLASSKLSIAAISPGSTILIGGIVISGKPSTVLEWWYRNSSDVRLVLPLIDKFDWAHLNYEPQETVR